MKNILIALVILTLFGCSKNKNLELTPINNNNTDTTKIDTTSYIKHSLKVMFNNGAYYMYSAGGYTYKINNEIVAHYDSFMRADLNTPNYQNDSVKLNDTLSIRLVKYAGYDYDADTFINSYSKVVIYFDNKLIAADSGNKVINITKILQ